MTTKYIEIDRAIETALLLLEEGEDEQTLAYNAALVAFIKNMENVPAADVEPRWIPCSERLPEDYTDVLAWFEYFRYGDYNCLYQTHGIGSYSTEYDSWMINHETGWHKLRVIAWMPLPEPYKGGEEKC